MKTLKDTASTVSKSLTELRHLFGQPKMTQQMADKYVKRVREFIKNNPSKL